MDLAVGSTSSLQSVQDPTGAPPSQPKTSPSAAENVAESGQRSEDVRAADKNSRPEQKADAAPRDKSSDLPPPPPESGRGQLVDIAA
ncbi:MAG: hypothetical protein ACFCVH_06730 [Alphaproteobacteria bacterium]